MTNAELIKSLRCCADDSTGCGECPFVGKCIHAHYMDLKIAAADAIQTLCDELATYHAKSVTDEKRIAELSLDNKMLKNTIDADKGVMLDRIRLLEAQMPKEGEWIVDKNGYPQIICSICDVHIPMVAGWCMDSHIKYCPNCGARMKGEHDGES